MTDACIWDVERCYVKKKFERFIQHGFSYLLYWRQVLIFLILCVGSRRLPHSVSLCSDFFLSQILCVCCSACLYVCLNGRFVFLYAFFPPTASYLLLSVGLSLSWSLSLKNFVSKPISPNHLYRDLSQPFFARDRLSFWIK